MKRMAPRNRSPIPSHSRSSAPLTNTMIILAGLFAIFVIAVAWVMIGA